MKKICIIVLALMVGACSRYASNGEDLYLKSHNGAQLTVPAPLSRDNISPFYDLPNQTQHAQVSIAPPV